MSIACLTSANADDSIRIRMIIISPICIDKTDLRTIIKGAVVVRRGVLLAVGPAERILNKFPGHRVLRLRNAVLLPGLVNLHTHLELPPLFDQIRAKEFPDWVLNLIKEKKNLKSGDYLAAARQNIETAIRTGTTTIGEICTHNISPSLLKNSGLRAVVFQEMICMNPESPVPRLASWVTRPSSLIQTGISPHAPHTVSKNVLLGIKNLSLEKEIPVCMHVAESKDEIRLLRGKPGRFEKLYKAAGWERTWAPLADSPFEYLNKLGLLGPNLLAVHVVQIEDKDIALIKRSRTPIAHCPRSNKQTGVGKMPLKRLLDAGITVGLGTDSLASSPSLNMWEEMRFAYQIHKRDGVTPRDILTMASINGAKALGIDRLTGSLEPGKRADLIAVPMPERNTGDIYSDLLRETKFCIMAMVDGNIVYHQKNFLLVKSNIKLLEMSGSNQSIRRKNRT